MRVLLLTIIVGLLVSATGPAAMACDPAFESCGRAVVVFPAYTPEGRRIGSVRDWIQRRPFLEISRTTGQPLTTLYNNPTRTSRAVDPDVYLMALPHAHSSHTRAVYPVGY